MKIKKHRLQQDDGTPITFIRSPNQGGPITPEYLVIHFTKGADAASSISWLTNPDANASAHLVIGRDGSVTQLVAFNHKAWHAGTSYLAGRSGLNRYSIGIELDNHGDLIGSAANWQTAWGKMVADNDVVELPHVFDNRMRGWHTYPEIQLLAATKIAGLLVEEYELKDIVGHDDIAPGRKFDPGPAFPMQSFRSAVFGRAGDQQDIFETITNLNIRIGPGTQYDKLPVSPLPKGTQLEILSNQGLWREVDVLDTINGEMDIVGWVHSRYIRRVV